MNMTKSVQHDIGSSGEKMFQYDTLDANVKKVKVRVK